MPNRILAGVGWWDALARRGPARAVAVSALLDAGGTGLVAVCFPFFAILSAGLTAARLAAVLAVGGICELAAAVPNGALAGRFEVGRFIRAAKAVQAVAYATMVIAPHQPVLFAMSAVAGVARAGSGGLNQTLAVAVLGSAQRAAVLGTVRGVRNVGYLVAGGLGSVVLALQSPLALRIAVAGQAAASLAVAWCVTRMRVGSAAAPRPGRLDFSVLADWPYLGLVVCATAFSSSLAVLDVGLPLWVLAHHAIPRPMVAATVIVNTSLVIVCQYRLAQRSQTVPAAVRGLWTSTACFALASALLAASGSVAALAAIVVLTAAIVALTFGEMLGSPAWWTLSYLLAPTARKDEYMAAFDLSTGMVWVVGPVAMAAVVAAGPLGWAGYALALAVAAAAAGRLSRLILARGASAEPESAPADQNQQPVTV